MKMLGVIVFPKIGGRFTPKYAGKLRSNLDHTLASVHLKVNEVGTRADGTPYFVRVDGWQQLEGNERKKFIEEISDHCSLWLEVEG